MKKGGARQSAKVFDDFVLVICCVSVTAFFVVVVFTQIKHVSLYMPFGLW